jgi:hypothetical protein
MPQLGFRRRSSRAKPAAGLGAIPRKSRWIYGLRDRPRYTVDDVVSPAGNEHAHESGQAESPTGVDRMSRIDSGAEGVGFSAGSGLIGEAESPDCPEILSEPPGRI